MSTLALIYRSPHNRKLDHHLQDLIQAQQGKILKSAYERGLEVEILARFTSEEEAQVFSRRIKAVEIEFKTPIEVAGYYQLNDEAEQSNSG